MSANDVDDHGCGDDDGDDYVDEAQFARFSFCTWPCPGFRPIVHFLARDSLKRFKPRWVGSLYFIDAALHGIQMKYC